MMMQIIPAVLALIALLAMVICAVSILRKREIEQELDAAHWQVRYHQRESEINLSVAQAITNTVGHRMMAVFGRDYVDYLAARQMNLPDFRQPEIADDTPFVVTYGDGRGRNLTGDSCQEWEERRAREEEYLLRQYQQSGYIPPMPPTMPPRNQSRAARFEQPYTPPQQWQPQPQVPAPTARRSLPYWVEDDDILDVEVYPPAAPVYPPALLPAPDDTADGGRPRKYGSNAERQAAYRRRKAARK